MILFFDTETNGLPKDYKAPVTDLDNWPRVIQLAWALYHEDGTLFDHACRLIKPNGWQVPKEKFWIENGHSTELCEAEGMPIEQALLEFLTPLHSCTVLVAHNLDFDHKILGAEILRTDIRPNNKPAKVCTMKASVDVCRIPGGPYGGFKWPKLIEIYRHLFQEEFDGAHDALNDVKACARVYFELKKRNLLPIT